VLNPSADSIVTNPIHTRPAGRVTVTTVLATAEAGLFWFARIGSVLLQI